MNGFSTSLPVEIQYEALHKVRGFENAKFFRQAMLLNTITSLLRS